MSMQLLTAIQILAIFAAYFFMVLLLPSLVFGGRIASYAREKRFLVCFLAGNLFMMNSVFLLAFFRLAKPWPLRIWTVAAFFLSVFFFRREGGRLWFMRISEQGLRLLGGTMGFRSFLSKARQRVFARSEKNGGMGRADALCFVLMIAGLAYVFGADHFSHYGYRFYDMVVHNKWINAIDAQVLFVDGIYPFGYHTVIYYLHSVFSLEVVTLLRLFGMVQSMCVALALWSVLRLLCRSLFLPYLAIFAYLGLPIWHAYAFERFAGPLPQEFGMMFLAPSLYFLLEFLRAGAKKSDLWFYGLGVSMTCSVHFYITLVALLGSVAIALAYLPDLFQRRRFLRLMGIGILSFALAVYPMAISLARGVPMQGSMQWAMNVMAGKAETQGGGVISGVNGTAGSGAVQQTAEATEEAGEEDSAAGSAAAVGDSSTAIGTGATAISSSGSASSVSGISVSGGEDSGGGASSGKDRILALLALLPGRLMQAAKAFLPSAAVVSEYVISGSYLPVFPFWKQLVLGLFPLSLALAAVSTFLDKGRGRLYLAVAGFLGLLLVVLASKLIGIPPLMDLFRTRIFFLYVWIWQAALCLDGCLFLVLRSKPHWLPGMGLALLCTSLAAAAGLGLYREPIRTVFFESDGAIRSLYSILFSRQPRTWTVISANDERQMGYLLGYHMEILDFLWSMEYVTPYHSTLIPTEYVYVFVEKQPINYGGADKEVLPGISEEGAGQPLPYGRDFLIYTGMNRWVFMSRLYYWCQAFAQLYPHDIRVYYEDREFICYEIRQNVYSTFNFAIDYVYNRQPED